MKKVNSVIYNKLVAQAEEAKEQGLTDLSSSILEAIGPSPEEGPVTYTYSELKEDIHRDIWKMATRLMHYYDVESVDAEKLDEAIISWAHKMVDELEQNIGVDSVVVGPLEPKVPGEDK